MHEGTCMKTKHVILLVAAAFGLLAIRQVTKYATTITASMPGKIASVPAGSYGKILEVLPHTQGGAYIEKVEIYSQKEKNSDEKLVRKGVLVRHPRAIATVLICHGFMCDKYDVAFLRHVFPSGLFNVMIFDFRGHGEEAQGQKCTLGRDEAYDVIAAGKFLHEHPDLKSIPVLAYAFSMGAVAAIKAQSKESGLFAGMVLDCPFDSTENMIKRGLENMKLSLFGYRFSCPGLSFLQQNAFHPYVQALVKTVLKSVAQLDERNIDVNICKVCTYKAIKKVEVPCFFIHCRNDEKVTIDAIKTVFQAAQGYKTLWLTNGRRHFDSYFYNPELYTERVTRFVEQVVHGTLLTNQHNSIVEDAPASATAGI